MSSLHECVTSAFVEAASNRKRTSMCSAYVDHCTSRVCRDACTYLYDTYARLKPSLLLQASAPHRQARAKIGLVDLFGGRYCRSINTTPAIWSRLMSRCMDPASSPEFVSLDVRHYLQTVIDPTSTMPSVAIRVQTPPSNSLGYSLQPSTIYML